MEHRGENKSQKGSLANPQCYLIKIKSSVPPLPILGLANCRESLRNKKVVCMILRKERVCACMIPQIHLQRRIL